MIAAHSNPLRSVLCALILVLEIILFVRVILSWAMAFGWRPPISGPFRKIIDLFEDVTEPVLRPLRRLIPPIRAGGVGLDLSVLVAFVILAVLQQAFC
jgi:YggT family protein